MEGFNGALESRVGAFSRTNDELGGRNDELRGRNDDILGGPAGWDLWWRWRRLLG